MKLKHWLSLIMAAVLLTLGTLPAYAASSVIGDVDSNGEINSADARKALRFAVVLEMPNSKQRTAADVDADGSVTSADARYILRMAVGLDTPYSVLVYATAHPYFNKTFNEIHPNRNYIELALDTVSDWCCYYTVHDVLDPVLKKLGYTDDEIERYAPTKYPSEKRDIALRNNRLSILRGLGNVVPWYVPSLLLDYYLEHPDVAESFVFYEYYDDVITNSVIPHTINAYKYTPQVGDLIFMSNKERTYVNDYPTVDHTAQIIQVNADGTFVCTEGAIIQTGEDGKARVRERTYYFDMEKGTYVFKGNSVVNVLVAVRLKLD